MIYFPEIVNESSEIEEKELIKIKARRINPLLLVWIRANTMVSIAFHLDNEINCMKSYIKVIEILINHHKAFMSNV